MFLSIPNAMVAASMTAIITALLRRIFFLTASKYKGYIGRRKNNNEL
jgi:hypothetical protein